MCTMSPYDFKLQDVHRDLSWMAGPDGLVMKAEQTVHFLKKSLSLHHSRGRSQLPCRLEKGFKVSPQLSKGSLAVAQSLSNPRWSHHQHYLFEPLTPPVGIRKPWNHRQTSSNQHLSTAFKWHARASSPETPKQYQTYSTHYQQCKMIWVFIQIFLKIIITPVPLKEQQQRLNGRLIVTLHTN